MDIRTQHLTIRRRVRYALLEPTDGPVTEVWFVLHGYNQLAHRFIHYFEGLRGPGRCIVAPEGLHRHYLGPDNERVGASWMTKEDRQTDIGDYVTYLDTLYGQFVQTRSAKAIVLGFSQGVHTACRWIAFGQAAFTKAVLWGADPPSDLDLRAHREVFSASDLHFVAGRDDEWLQGSRLRAAHERLHEAGIPFTPVEFPGGHRMDRSTLKTLAGFR